MHGPGPTAAAVKIITSDNETFQDAFQFDPGLGCGCGCAGATGAGATGPSWTLGPNLRMDIKRNRSDTAALLSLTSAAGEIVVDDPVNRLCHFNVPENTLTTALIPGEYVYDFVQYDNSNPPIRTVLMGGIFRLTHGVSGG